MKILLAIDGSSHSKALVQQFSGRTFAPRTKVRIIHVFQRTSYMMNSDPLDTLNVGTLTDYYSLADKQVQISGERILKNAEAVLRKKQPGLSITIIAAEGSPKSVILAEAENYGADLIVVGSHGQGALSIFLLGSVSQAIALHAKCSVEIVRKAAK